MRSVYVPKGLTSPLPARLGNARLRKARLGERMVPFTVAPEKVDVASSAVSSSQEAAESGGSSVPITVVVNGVVQTEAVASNGNGKHSNGNGNGAAYAANGNGNGAASAKANGVETIKNLDAVLGTPEEKKVTPGQAAAAAAAAAVAAAAARAVPTTTAGTPYANPGGRWSQFQSYSVFQRTFDIWKFAFTFFFKLWAVNQKFSYGKGGMTPDAVSVKKRELAKWLTEGLVKLGPTFIKIGQQFSTRVDVLSKEFIEELERLQDDVPPFEWDSARGIIESSLGCRLEDKYESFNATPIAAASLGQVYRAKKRGGEEVVVKVQRPGLKQLFDIDLKNIRVIAQWLQKVDPKTDGAARDWVAIYDECARILYQEIDYTMEGSNATRFQNNFKEVPWIKVPSVHWELTTPQILTMEYVPGIKINRAEEIERAGLDKTKLGRLAVESYLMQILRHGFFHADPHPGNVAVSRETGQLIYYDFGMMGSIPNDVRGGLVKLFYGVYEKDADKCLDALIQMGVLVPTTNDKTAVRRTAEFFLKTFQDRLQQQRAERENKGDEYSASFKPQRSKEEAKERRKQILAAVGEDLLSVANDQPFRFPAEFTFVVRSFTVLDGIGKTLDPRFDITEISAPYARELLLEARPQFARFQDQFAKGLVQQNRAVKNLFVGPNTLEDLGAFAKRLEQGDVKLRVRALEAERALQRVQLMQGAVLKALVASMLVNVGTVLAVSGLQSAAAASFTAAGALGVMIVAGLAKVSGLVRKEKQIMGQA